MVYKLGTRTRLSLNRLVAAAMSTLATKTIAQTEKTHTATVFFFHGSGDTGSNLVEWVRFLLGGDMQFGHVKTVFPTAPLRPYTPLGGQKSNVWFDRRAIDPLVDEKHETIADIHTQVGQLIDAEVAAGIPLHRIIVGGFSMGGALSLHAAYTVRPGIRGCFVLSSFLNHDSGVYESLRQRQDSPDASQQPLAELLMMHGDRDTLVRAEWSRDTFAALRKYGVDGEFEIIKNTLHELKTDELKRVQRWIEKLVPAHGGPAGVELVNKL